MLWIGDLVPTSAERRIRDQNVQKEGDHIWMHAVEVDVLNR